MSRPLMSSSLVVIVFVGLLTIVFVPKSSLVAQSSGGLNLPYEPEFPVCSDGTQEVLQFGSGHLQSFGPAILEAHFDFYVPNGYGPEGEVLVWQGEGHEWDSGCPDSGAANCGQNQLYEVITFTVNGDAIGQFVDHSPEDDRSEFYTFPVDGLVSGADNMLSLHHLNEDDGRANSVFYKGVVCAVVADMSTPEPASTNTPVPTTTPTPTTVMPADTPTATPTSTATSVVPAATPTSTPTLTPTPFDDSGPTSLDPVDQPSPPDQAPQTCSIICQFLPFILER